VMMPAKNLKNLMLRDEVVEAVKNGQFHIWAVSTIDEGIEVLTGIEAGKRQDGGGYPEGTINYRVDKTLKEMANKLRYFSIASKDGEGAMPFRQPRTPVRAERKKRTTSQ
jgi:predicted ATP-dependent protease